MLKKKNIAMVMAAATVATSVAPVFAAGTQNADEATIIAKVTELLKVKYFGTEDLVYTIKAGDDAITTETQLKQALANAKVAGTSLKIVIRDNGHQIVNGRIIKELTDVKYGLYSQEELKNLSVSEKIVKSIELTDIDGEVTSEDTEIEAATLTLASGKTIKLSVGDKELDFNKPVDANGKLIDVRSITETVAKQVVGFEINNELKLKEIIPGKVSEIFVYNAQETQVVKLDTKDFKDENGYTEKGAYTVSAFALAAEDILGTAKDNTVVYNGKSYKINISKKDADALTTVYKDGVYQAKFDLTYVDGAETTTKDNDKSKTVSIVLTSDNESELKGIVKDIQSRKTVSAGMDKVKSLAGNNRFETAIEISKGSYDKHDSANGEKKAEAVVLVGRDAIVDGLAASPLAKQRKAPILLTNKDAIGNETIDEIKRVIPKNSTVFLVGGENTISKEVEAQLIKEMNAKIVRLAGDNRYETSVKIAENMKKVDGSAMTQAFVVGGEGEADAMSIAAVAANKTVPTEKSIAPIIVAKESGLTQDAKDFLYLNKTALTNVDVVGGTSKVSRQVLKDIQANVDKNDVVARVAGDNRQETNAMVIEKFYAKDNTDATTKAETGLTGVYLAKDGAHGNTNQLIDALAAAPLAGRTATPIVLATDSISGDQVKAIKENIRDITANGTDKKIPNHTMAKVGNGIATSVVKSLKELFTL